MNVTEAMFKKLTCIVDDFIHNNNFDDDKPLIIAVEGSDYSGKSSLIDKLLPKFNRSYTDATKTVFPTDEVRKKIKTLFNGDECENILDYNIMNLETMKSYIDSLLPSDKFSLNDDNRPSIIFIDRFIMSPIVYSDVLTRNLAKTDACAEKYKTIETLFNECFNKIGNNMITIFINASYELCDYRYKQHIRESDELDDKVIRLTDDINCYYNKQFGKRLPLASLINLDFYQQKDPSF